MPANPIIEEIHAIREKLAEAADYDPEKMAKAARIRESESGWKPVTLPSRPVASFKKKAS
jgi:hypothetical protein